MPRFGLIFNIQTITPKLANIVLNKQSTKETYKYYVYGLNWY